MAQFSKRVLVTGGAGFIGRSLCRKLVGTGWTVTVLDSLLPQVHPSGAPELPDGVRFVKGEVQNASLTELLMRDVDFVVHLAAETGVGQSAYEIARYVGTNELGTAIVLQAASQAGVRGIVFASSRAVYGEGSAQCGKCHNLFPAQRQAEALTQGVFEVNCPACGSPAQSLPMQEDQAPKPTSIYGVTKLNQEQMLEVFCRSYGISGVSFRFQNVYGPGQALGNPYTGILTIFTTRLQNGRVVEIYEDGLESRDFVYVDDVVDAMLIPLDSGFRSSYDVVNVGTGRSISVLKAAKLLREILGTGGEPQITGKYRIGDIRHAVADTRKAESLYGFHARVPFEDGLRKFVEWVFAHQHASADTYDTMFKEMNCRGLILSAVGTGGHDKTAAV